MNGSYPNAAPQATDNTQTGSWYQIKVKGVLDQHWSERFGGLAISNHDGFTIISGQLIDQAALHGLLMQIRDLGLQLLLVEQIESEEQKNNISIKDKQLGGYCMSESKYERSKWSILPVNKVVCVIETQEGVDALVSDLIAADFNADNVLIHHGEEGNKYIDSDGSQHGFFSQMIRKYQHLGGPEERMLNMAQQGLDAGHYLVGLQTNGTNTEWEPASEVMKKHTQGGVFFCGRTTIHVLQV